MSKSIYEEALEYLKPFRWEDKKEKEAYEVLKELIEQAQKQEQLLELYKELSFIRLLLSAEFKPDEELRLMNKVDKILKQIVELEYE